MWSFYLMDTPLNTAVSPATGQIGELSLATGRSLTFNMNSPDTFNFSMPGRSQQAALIEPLVSDIIAYRDNRCVQRFRVMSSDFSKDSGELRVSYTASSYDALLDSWLFAPADLRAWPIATEQSLIAWTILNNGQTKEDSALGITRGVTPTSTVNRTLIGEFQGGADEGNYFMVGTSLGQAITQLASMDTGFEFLIEPDRSTRLSEMRGLKFHCWNEGSRKQYTPRCPLVLDDGGNVRAWTRKTAPSEFANVVYGVGVYPEGVATADDPPPRAWSPTTKNPAGTPQEGRWEKQVSFDVTASANMQAATDGALDRLIRYQPEWSVSLFPGRWEGPTQMWIGDYCRTIINDGPVVVDADMRVDGISISVGDDGQEEVSLQLDRPARTYGEFRDQLERRLQRLERR